MKSRRIGQSRQFEDVAVPEPIATAAPSPAVTCADAPRSGKPSQLVSYFKQNPFKDFLLLLLNFKPSTKKLGFSR